MSDYKDMLSTVPLNSIKKYIVQHCNCVNCARDGDSDEICPYWVGYVTDSKQFYCTDWLAKEPA
jgi:hypothetical protein